MLPRARRAYSLITAICLAIAILPAVASADSVVAELKLTASDAAEYDRFGLSISLSGDTVVIGADGDDNVAPDAGAAYVFTRDDGTWVEQAKLTAPGSYGGWEYFGESVALSGDTAVVGAPQYGSAVDGSAFVFVRDGDTWSQQAELTASDGSAADNFGKSVAISGDTVVVGAYWDDDGGDNAGSAYVFTRTGEVWTEQAKLTASDGAADDSFGWRVGIDGETAVIGAFGNDGAGAAYVFTRNGTTWDQQAKLIPADLAAGDRFGFAVAVSDDTVAVGSYRDDDGGEDTGSAYTFTRAGEVWTEEAKLTASNAGPSDLFGNSVAISGEMVVVGASGGDEDTGSAYVFTRLGDSWVERTTWAASDGAAANHFGYVVALEDSTVFVGAFGDAHAGTDSGAAYVFDLALRPYAPTLTVHRDAQVVEGHGWLVGDEVWLVVDDPSVGDDAELVVSAVVEPAPWDPDNASYVEFRPAEDHGLELEPGFWVSITDFITTKSHLVTDVTVTGIDPVAETVSGTASPGATVTVEVLDEVFTDVWENLAFQLSPGRFDRNPDSLNEYLDFRHAVAHAIDRDALRDAADPGGEVMFSYLTEGNGGLVGDGWTQYSYDPAAATAGIDGLCDDLARDCGTGSGWTEPPVAVFTTSDSPHRQAIADQLVAMLGAVGIEVVIELEPVWQFFDETLGNRTFDMGEWAWGLDLPGLAGLAIQHRLFDPDEVFEPNPYGWGTADSSVVNAGTVRMAELVQLMQSETDASAMEALIFEAEQILADQVPFIPLYVRSEQASLGYPTLEVVADGSGNWTADFSLLYDLEPQVEVVAIDEDTDGDSTRSHYRLPGEPEFGVTATHDWIEFFDFAGETITFTFDDDDDVDNGVLYEETIFLEPYAYNYHHLLDWFDIEVGQYVTVTDGFVTKTHQVLGVAVTDVDIDNWVMYGTADSGVTIDTLGTHPDVPVFGPHDVVVDGTGHWELHLDEVIDPNERPAQIPEGMVLVAGQRDGDLDRTVTFWDPANVEGRVLADGVPVAGAEVWYPYGFGSHYGCTDADGYFSIPVSVVRHLVQGLLGAEHFAASGRAVSADAACMNPGFVDALGAPLLTVYGTAVIDVQQGINYVELHTGPAAAYQTVHVGDAPPDFDPLDYALVHVYNRSDLDFIVQFGTDVSAMDFDQVFWSGTGRITADLTSGYLSDDPGTLELRYPAITDVLVLAQLADGSIVGDVTDHSEFVANAVAAHGPSLYLPNRPPQIDQLVGPAEWVTGENLSVFVDVSDLNVHDAHTAVFDWGDGTVSVPLPLVDGVVSASFQYMAPGSYMVEVTVTDSGGASTVGYHPVDVLGRWDHSVSGDFTGDGKSDVAMFDSGTGLWSVGPSTGTSMPVMSVWSDMAVMVWDTVLVGDYNGDGKDDIAMYVNATGHWWIAVSDGSGFSTSSWSKFTASISISSQYVGDFNGDGLDDVANFEVTTGKWWVSVSLPGQDRFGTSTWSKFTASLELPTQLIGDINGDGLDDLANYHLESGKWFLSLSDGTKFSTYIGADGDDGREFFNQFIGDFNGDGKDDLASYDNVSGEWLISLSQGTSLADPVQWSKFTASIVITDQFIGDFNGDGNADVANFEVTTGKWWMSLGAPDQGRFLTSTWSKFTPSLVLDPQLIGDLNGDGMDDLINYLPASRRWFGSISTGGNFATYILGDA